MNKILHVFLLLIIAGTLTVSIAQVAGDYRSNVSFLGGNWSDATSWQKYIGSTWVTPSPDIPNFTSNNTLTILSGDQIELDMNTSVGNIVVNGELSNFGTLKGIFVYGDITVTGVLGNSTQNIVILLDNTGLGTNTVSGSGFIGLKFFAKSDATNDRTLDLQTDVSLYGPDPFQNGTGKILTVTTTSGTLNLLGTTTSSSPDVVYNFSSGTVEYSGGAQTVFGISYNNLTLSGSGVKTIASNTVTGDMTLAGTAIVSGIIDYAGTGQLIYNGSSAQLTGDELHSAANFNNLLINNLAGVVLRQDATIPNFTGTVGNLITGANTLTFTGTTTETDLSHVHGNLKTTKTVGTGTGTFGGIGFELSSGLTNLGSVTVLRQSSAAAVGSNSSIAKKYVITVGGTDGQRIVTQKWFPSEDNGKDATQMELWQNVGGTWTQIGPTNVNASSNPRSMTATFPTIAGTVTATDNNNSLPVELTSFSAILTDKAVLLNWITATEVNNYGFDVERMRDGEDWKALGFVEGNGNSNSPKEYSFVDNTVSNAGTYYYRLKQIDNDGTYEFSKAIEVNFGSPINFELNQNYPNPFNPTTTISFNLPQSGNVTLKVFNSIGEEVVTLTDGYIDAGVYTFNFNADGLPSGMYIYQLNTPEKTQVRKMILMK